MSYCPQCQIDGHGMLCARCNGVMAEQSPAEAAATARWACAGSYALGALTGVYFLVSPQNVHRTVRYHAWQSILFTGAAVAAHFLLWAILQIGFGMIQSAGLGNWDLHPYVFLSSMAVAFVAMLAVYGTLLAVWVGLILRALDGKTLQLPLISRYAAERAGG